MKNILSLLVGFFLAMVYLLLPLKFFIGFLLVSVSGLIFLFNARAGVYLLIFILLNRYFLIGGQMGIGLPISFDASGFINVSIVLIGFVYVVVKKVNIFSDMLSRFIVLFLVYCLISCLWANDIALGLKYFVRLCSPISICLIVREEFKNQLSFYRLIDFILLCSIIPISLACYQFFVNFGHYYRLNSLFGHPNPFSFYLIALLPLCYVEIFRSKRFINKTGFVILLMLMISFLSLSYCRIAWIAFFFQVIILFTLEKKRSPLIIILFGLLLLSSLNWDFFYERINESSFDSGTGSVKWRFLVWDRVWTEFLKKPFFGYGLRAHFSLLKSYFGIDTSIHNTYLELLYDLGVFGVSLFVAIITQLFSSGFKIFKESLSKPKALFVQDESSLVLIYLCNFVAFLIILVSDNLLEYYDVVVYFGLSFIVPHIMNQKEKADEKNICRNSNA
jgi:O-antigen ligase